MPVDISNLDHQVEQSISKIDKYVKDPLKTGSLDTELDNLLKNLNAATNEISDPAKLADHKRRIEKLQAKITEYQKTRDSIQLKTRADLAETMQEPDKLKLIALKKTLEQEVTSITTVEEAKKLLDKLGELDADSRKIVVSYLWSKLAHSGYSMSVQNGKVALMHVTDSQGATAIETTIRAYIDSGKVNLSEIQRAVIVGSPSFGNFLDAQSVNLSAATTNKYADFLSKSYQIDLSKGNVAQKVKTIHASLATAEEKAFLISYINGGFTDYNLAPDAERQYKIRQGSRDLIASPGFVQVQTVVDKASGGAMVKEQQKMQQSGKQSEMTMDSFMNNPAEAIGKYPWTSLTLIIGGIWKFGFMKTIGGLLFGAIGIKALNEIGGETEIGKQIKDGLKKGASAASDTIKEAAGATTAAVTEAVRTNTATAASSTPEIVQLSAFQKDGVKSIENNKSLLEDISNYPKQAGKDKQNADVGAYIHLLHKDSIQNMTLDKLIYTSDHEQSIFSDTVKSQFGDNKDISDNMSRYLLKKMIRSYIGINASLSIPANNQKEGQQSLEDFKKKFPEGQWKNKTLKELVTEIYKK